MESIIELRKKTGVLVAAHRGTSGGNIPPNSIAAFDIALKEGADILEMVSKYRWRIVCIPHRNGTEPS